MQASIESRGSSFKVFIIQGSIVAVKLKCKCYIFSMASEGDDAFVKRLNEFKEAVASISSENDLNDCAKKISQVLPWEHPVGLPEVITSKNDDDDDDEDSSSQIDEDITEFYNKHVHIAETQFQVAVLHVNFILEYLQTVLESCKVPSVKVCCMGCPSLRGVDFF